MRLRAATRARWLAWWRARHPRRARQRLDQRNVYILPTGAGWLYGALLLALLLGSINYQLNLGYLLSFVLTSAGGVALLATHAALRGIELGHAGPETLRGQAGQALELPLRLSDVQARSRLGRWLFLGRHGLMLRWRDDAAAAGGAASGATDSASGSAPEAVDLPTGGTLRAQPAWTAPRRGLHPWPLLHLETRYPLGLLRAWTLWRPSGELCIWPAPEPDAPPWPVDAPAQPEDAGTPPSHPAPPRFGAGLPEPDGVRPWRQGDRPSQVLWRRSARLLEQGGELLVRELLPPPPAPRTLDWRQTATLGADVEARLARLCAWLLQADRAGSPYTLRLPGQLIGPGHGAAHRLACLDALAGFEAPGADRAGAAAP